MKKRKIIWLIVLFVVLAASAIFTVIWVRDTMGRARAVLNLVNELRAEADADLNKETIQNAIEISGDLSTAIDDLEDKIEPILPVIRSLEKLPLYGGYFGNVEPGLEFASNLMEAVVILGQTAQPIINEGFTNSDLDQLQAVYEFFSSNQSSFAKAEIYFRNAEANWQRIDPEFMPGRFSAELSTIEEYMQLSSSMFDVVEVIPDLLGSDEPINYLFLVQNKDELRPTGGFITGFGILQLKEGRIMALKIDDSTTINTVSEIRNAPYPLPELMFAHYLTPRDANWSPDFPTAARATKEMFKISTQLESDVVIAFDQHFVVGIIDFIGPITASQEIGEINAENFESKMIEFKDKNTKEGKIEERKAFLSLLAPQLMGEVFRKNQFSDLFNLGRIVFNEMRLGHLAIYFKDPDIQKLIESYNLDGAVNPGDGDYIMLVDANIGFAKIDKYIKRSINYSLDLRGTLEKNGKLLIRYEHTGDQDIECFQGTLTQEYVPDFSTYNFSRCYWNYWRVLLPDNAEINNVQFTEVPLEYFYEGVEWDQTPDIGDGVNNTTEVGGLIVVPQLSEQTVEINYQIPQTVLIKKENGDLAYSLRIQKENGIEYLPIEIHVIPPEGYEPLDLEDSWIYDKYENILYWEGVIDRATDFYMEFSESELEN